MEKNEPPRGTLGCVIMASGQGKRFGGNKLMADFRGRPMVVWALEATKGLFARRVVVTRHREVEALCRALDVPVLRHDLPYRSDTVRLGLEQMDESITGCLFCPGDQPLLSRESLQAMVLAAEKEPDFIWQLSHGETRGTPVLFPKWAFDALRNLPQGKGGSAVIQKNPGRVRLVPARDGYEMLDVDSPEDLLRLEQIGAR